MVVVTLKTGATTTQRFPVEGKQLRAVSATVDDASAAVHTRLRLVIKKGSNYKNPLQLAEGWVSGYDFVGWFGTLPLDQAHDSFLELVGRNDTGSSVELNLNWRLGDEQ